jgi:hypothetical protein
MERLLQVCCFLLNRGVVLFSGTAEEVDELLLSQAIELLNVHYHGLATHVLDLLRQPLERFNAVIPGG